MREKVKALIEKFVENYTKTNCTETEWEKPIVAFAKANDPLFFQLKKVVSQTHKLPKELLKEAKTVISYFIPFKEAVISSNSINLQCSKEWAVAYIETNKLISELNKFLSNELKELNFESIILPPTHNFDEKKLISDWSHKHIAYIAGLGKFGLHKMLITDKGCCGRLGSLITSAEIKPTKRKNEEYCLYFYNQTCKKCVEICFYYALKVDYFDRSKCYEVCLENAKIYSKYGLADVCGKCACGVPCSLINPVQ